jgi:hypothetical protein
MPTVSYDDPASLFRRYEPWECEEDGGYPFIWTKISEVRCAERLYRCADCGFAYLEDGDILTVHHCNFNKADCRVPQVALFYLGFSELSRGHPPFRKRRERMGHPPKAVFGIKPQPPAGLSRRTARAS